MATETNFGSAGVRTVRVFTPSVIVRFVVGQFLRFRLTVAGAEALFSFDCEDKNRLVQSDFEDHPTDVYQWDLGVGKDQEPDSGKDEYAVGILFTTALKYTLEVDRFDADETHLEQVIDIDYESEAPEDTFSEALTVLRHS